MKIKQVIIFLTSIILIQAVKGQDSKKPRNELGLSLFSYEMNGETLNHGFEPKLVAGPCYIRKFGRAGWVSGIEFGRNKIKDENVFIADSYYGNGILTELNIFSGIRYAFLREENKIVAPYLESDIFYSRSHYEGDFAGGFSGDGTIRDNIFNTAGIAGRAGFLVFPAGSFVINLSASVRFGYVNSWYPLAGTTDNSLVFTAVTLIQVRMGYMF